MPKQLTAEFPFSRVRQTNVFLFVNGKLPTVHLIETAGAYFKETVVLHKQTGVFFFNLFQLFLRQRCIFGELSNISPLLGHVRFKQKLITEMTSF